MKVLNFPLAKITLSFVLGVMACYYLKPSLYLALGALAFCVTILFFLYFLVKDKKTLQTHFGVSTYLTCFFIGITTLLFHNDSQQKSHYTHCKKAFAKPQLITMTVREKLKSNDYNQRYIAIIKRIESNYYSGRIILNIQKDSTTNELQIGNIIQIQTTLHAHSFPKNPNQFDYGRYLIDKQIYAQIYSEKSAIKISKTLQKDIWYYTSQLHSRIIHNLEKNHFSTPEMNVALALILGQRQEIASDIIQDYQFSGATHILSVSGLHVGFIMLFITFILKPIPNNRKGSLLKLIAIIGSLIVFAVVSGLSPSVLRSVVMFSFLAIGNHLRRNGNLYHTLLVSLFLILLFEPYFLFDVGFQLSYLALFFILWLQPLLKQFWKPKNKISDYIWNVLTVSIAAQIGTLPLCLYYFHQFPGLFFITNLVISPFLSFIMLVGIVVVLLAVINANPLFLITIFEKSIYCLNQIIHFIASFDFFVIRNIHFNLSYLIIFYILIFASILWLKQPTYTKLSMVLSTVIALQIAFIHTKKKIDQTEEIIVYNIKNKTLISKRNGHEITLFASDYFSKKESQDKILSSYLIENSTKVKAIHKIKNALFFKSSKIFIIDSSGIYKNNIQPDIVFLIQSPKINVARMLQDLHPKIIIADASNRYALQKYWKATCAKKNIPFHATVEKGYYKIE
ncbi:ComEC/Rec2 family competence protein [Flavobacterium sp. Fl-77]|uniref:ComEC/Rec2 family competence protein n=1 Tax=Flavobacterium flavipigmentatum TaxID=2893884 RepID=A0AAJ2VX73_9FLAO|nr:MULTISPECIES: ComEC/Rec2 family competence protein [unclassified Flavobacterium]MDX6181318.1 ComEC/Rec2 family competence protein [Flavobacterium sp. Fl-33]MDX6184919.1 ComEC/Rec2 family competence protein [Flavobacterium sp. Fl-77]UFH40012.1 competence protein ComEC family protein [Flavobacterium sp. F-70]